MERDYAKINFYSEFNRRNTIENDVSTYVKEKGEESRFYELCAEFLDIALDAPKYKDGTTVICEKDFESAAASAIIYAEEHNVLDIEDLLDLIYAHHSHAVRKNETRSLGGRVMEYDSRGMGGIGMFYDFSKIPANIWETIKSYILNKIN